MKLENKKALAARTLKVGKNRIIFNQERLSEIKEAITKQDIKDLLQDKAIIIREIKGSLTKKKRKTRRRAGSIKKKVNTRKKDYMTLTRKLRAYLRGLKRQSLITQENFISLRKKIRAKQFRSLSQLKDSISKIEK